MRVLGVDPGTRFTGYGLVEESGDRLQCLGMGVIAPSARFSLPEKLKCIYDRLTELILEFSPGVLVVENTFLSKNIQVAFKLGQARGVALLVGALGGLQVAEYSPLQIKNAVTGYGRAEKAQVSFMVTRLLGLAAPPETDHAADALAAAICHYNSSRLESLQNRISENAARR
ncbi:MAG TPA: crossover junction endodeoxyribonuclease RuvC [Nitrospiria bacterium]|nr:crossover junction endodeoxyribonuclease RuvC [Nitrospiria bacterium]